MSRKLFRRAQSKQSQYVMFTVTVRDAEKFSEDQKRFAREKINNLFVSLSHHPNYVGCFDKGLTMFNDNCFGICCELAYMKSLQNTIDRFIKGFGFDVIIGCGFFDTMDYAQCDTMLYGGELYTILRNAHKHGGVGRKFYKVVKAK